MEPTTETTNAPTMATIEGGKEYVAKKRDGSTEKVTIRELTIRQISKKWIFVATEEEKQVELYCERPEGWDDTLTIESHEEILKIGGAMNRPTIARWSERRRADLVELQGMTKGIVLPPSNSSSPSAVSSAKPLAR